MARIIGPEGGGDILWLHGASAGELLAAVPVVRALRRRRKLRLLATAGSPSANVAFAALEPDFGGPPPLDCRRDCEKAFAAVRPGVLVLPRGDVWPSMVSAAVRRGVPVVITGGVVRSRSNRLRTPARQLLARSYARLSAVGAATAADAERLARLGVSPDVTVVTGDPAFDSVLASTAETATDNVGGPLRLIAGSTWPEDEAALIAAWDRLSRGASSRRQLQLVLVPHEPTRRAVAHLTLRLERAGHGCTLWSERPDVLAGAGAEARSAGVVVVDRVGILGDLYGSANMAYVGGGLPRKGRLGLRGLHNVLEPAAAGLPVVFGCRHDREDARGLEAAGGGFSVSGESLIPTLRRLLDHAARHDAGRRARQYVLAGAGAAEPTADLIESVWPERPPASTR
ncbi:MAG: hypothetical protein J4G03_03415 [Gemmatimonadetes bacterium]|nr:hypothetical protein [Gemmatimonadota bacterium]